MTLTIKPRPDRRRAPEEFSLPHRWVQVGCDAGADHVTVYIPQGTLEEIWRHARAHPHIEVGGYMFGRAYADGQRAIVDIQGIYAIISTDATVSHFRFKVEDSLQAEQYQQRHFPDSEIVGWFHTHPGHGVFMSSTDMGTHIRYFSPFHRVAMVIDPLLQRFGAFAHRDGVVYSLRSVRVVLCDAGLAPIVIPAVLPRGEAPAEFATAASPDPTEPEHPDVAPVGWSQPLGPAAEQPCGAAPKGARWVRWLRLGASPVVRLVRILSAWVRISRSQSATAPESLPREHTRSPSPDAEGEE